MMLPPPLRSSTICNLLQVSKPLPALSWPLNIWCGLLDEVGTRVDNACAARTGGHNRLEDTAQTEGATPAGGATVGL